MEACKMALIEKTLHIEELIDEFQWTVSYLAKKGIVCVECGEPIWGTLEEAARKAGIADIDALIEEMNEINKQNENNK